MGWMGEGTNQPADQTNKNHRGRQRHTAAGSTADLYLQFNLLTFQFVLVFVFIHKGGKWQIVFVCLDFFLKACSQLCFRFYEKTWFFLFCLFLFFSGC